MKNALAALMLLASLGTIGSAQGTLEIAIDTFPGPGPAGNHSFYTGGERVAGNGVLSAPVTDVVRTEVVHLRITTSPSPLPVNPGLVNPRRLLVLAAPVDPAGLGGIGAVLPEGPLFLNFNPSVWAMVMPVVEIVNSFANPLDPVFGPLLGGPNTIDLTINLDFFPIVGGGGTSRIVFQALAEDSYLVVPPSLRPQNSGLLLSGGVQVDLIAPSSAGFAPTLTGLSAASTPESMPGMVTLFGTNFLAQSNWIVLRPTITFGGQPVGPNALSVLSDTEILLQVPAPSMPTNPPRTLACDVDITYQNHPALDPGGVIVQLTDAFTYVTAQAPAFRASNSIVMADPTASGVDPENPGLGTIFGTWLLDGIEVTFTQAGAPQNVVQSFATLSAVNQGQPAATRELEIPFTAPLFCRGPVSVSLRNCDGRTSLLDATLTYRSIDPLVSAAATAAFGQMIYAAPANIGGSMNLTAPAGVPVVREAMAPFHLLADPTAATPTGTAGFITASSPLATAPTVAPGFSATTATIDFAPDPAGVVAQPGLVAQARERISGTPTVPNQAGLRRPGLGFKTLTLTNPSCVSNAPSTTSVLVQDENPPVLSGISYANGAQEILVSGMNFFTLLQTGTPAQTFPPPTTPPAPPAPLTPIALDAMFVPAVLFRSPLGGSVYAPGVFVESTGQLRVALPEIPQGLACLTVDTFIINPDGQVSQSLPFTIVAPLTRTEPASVMGIPAVLDEAGLRTIIDNTHQWVTGASAVPPPILAIVNPCPVRDSYRDPFSDRSMAPGQPGAGVGLPIPVPSTSYELVFLFNTRDAAGNPQIFRFDEIDLPQTLTFNAGDALLGHLRPRLTPFFPTTSTTGLAAGSYRVILKAVGANLGGAFSAAGGGTTLAFTQAENFPLYVECPGDAAIDGLIQLSGDCFLPEAALSGDRFQAQVRRTIPPAGAGQGGKGGVQGNPVSVPAINPGVTSLDLRGGDGSLPSHSVLITNAHGRGAQGSAPIALTVGSGGGGGYATAGVAGIGGGAAGSPFGSFTSLCPNGPSGIPGNCPAMTGDDRFVFGWTSSDFTVFGEDQVFPLDPSTIPPMPYAARGLFFGGSGGGGGGGIFSLIGFVAALGGRGGNGGGAFLLITDSDVTFRDAGSIQAAGELGLPGIQQFPSAGAPATSLASPGAGGSGAGGTIFVLTTRGVGFFYTSSAIAQNAGVTRPFLDARGVSGTSSLQPVPLAGSAALPSGLSGDGRIRIAVNAQASNAGTFATTLFGMFQDSLGMTTGQPPLILPVPVSVGPMPMAPAVANPFVAQTGDFYRYPCN